MPAINIAEIQTNKERVSVYKTDYSEKLNEYRENYPDYSFYRFDNEIFAWHNKPTDIKLPDEFESYTITKDDNTLVFKEILEQGIVHFFKNREQDIFRKKYSSIWIVNLEKAKKIDFKGFTLYPRMEFQVNPLYSTQQNAQVISISIRKTYKPVFTFSDIDFKNNNIDIRRWDRNGKNELVFSPRNRKRFLDATNQTNYYQKTLNRIYSLENEYKEFLNLIKAFNKYADSIYLPDELKITDFFFSTLPNNYFKSLTIQRPTYYFFNNRTGTGYYNQQLRQLKPYSFNSFKKNQFKIAVFTPSKHEGSTGSFIKHLKDNLISNFHASNIQLDLIKFERDASLEFIKELVNKTDEGSYNLAITVLSQSDKKLSIKNSPYFLLKAKLLGRKIPTQQLTIEVIRKISNSTDLILNSIALNIYSKLGGTAWTIEKDEKERVEIIIGIGTTINFNKQRIIGFANVFDYKGSYLIGSSSQICNFNNYSKNLEKHLINTINNQIKIKGIDKTDTFRLIFHLSKPASKKYEIKAIENALKKFAEYNIQYAIVHLSYNHNYRLFNNSGNSIPRGTYVEIASRQALLHLGQNSKAPILLRIDKRSVYDDDEKMYKDLYAVAKQVLYFSHLSYRSFKPANVPVTIKYPQLMSKLSSELMVINDWDKSNLEIVKNQLWFI
jgi:hypothetical protein